MRRDRLVILVVLALVAIAVPAGAQGRPVMVYGVIHEYTLARLMQLYERQAGGKADFIRLSAGEVATRVQAERQAPKGDVIFGISRAIAESMKAQGLLEPYKTPRRADVPSRYADPDGRDQQRALEEGARRSLDAEDLGGPAGSEVPGADRRAEPAVLGHRLHVVVG
jgi:ABC-type thiamine transport system substrate-binding protein